MIVFGDEGFQFGPAINIAPHVWVVGVPAHIDPALGEACARQGAKQKRNENRSFHKVSFLIEAPAFAARFPPSIGINAPVIQLDESDARKTANPLMSSGWPRRPAGMPL